jgi:RNA polymerase sigma-70 factor (ECF subfamily)
VILPEQEDTVDTKMEKQEILNLLKKVFRKLDAKDRLILTLRDIEGKSYTEIAEILKCSPGTVASQLSRARQKLKEQFKPYFDKLNGKEGKTK